MITLLAVILIIAVTTLGVALRRHWPRASRVTLVLTVAGLALALLLVAVLPAGGAGDARARLPKRFYGMSGQTLLPQSEHNRMRANGVRSVRIGISWNTIEPSPGNYDFSSSDPYVARAAKAGLEIFPFLGATPTFYGVNCTPQTCFRSLPAQNAQQLSAWKAVVRALIRRYGSNGSFWAQNPGIPKHPIRYLQPWNEENFSFFTDKRSPALYGKLVKATHQAVKGVDQHVNVVLGGLFAHPPKAGQGPDATTFLNGLYKVKGIKGSFAGVALHPYAKDASQLKPDINQIRRVMKRHGDGRSGLFLTEFGWGSAHDTGFEKGLQGQVRELTQAYTLLRRMQASANIVRTYWFAWNDLSGSCNFCDSAGLVRANFSAKPALARFKAFATGKR